MVFVLLNIQFSCLSFLIYNGIVTHMNWFIQLLVVEAEIFR